MAAQTKAKAPIESPNKLNNSIKRKVLLPINHFLLNGFLSQIESARFVFVQVPTLNDSIHTSTHS